MFGSVSARFATKLSNSLVQLIFWPQTKITILCRQQCEYGMSYSTRVLASCSELLWRSLRYFLPLRFLSLKCACFGKRIPAVVVAYYLKRIYKHICIMASSNVWFWIPEVHFTILILLIIFSNGFTVDQRRTIASRKACRWSDQYPPRSNTQCLRSWRNPHGNSFRIALIIMLWGWQSRATKCLFTGVFFHWLTHKYTFSNRWLLKN